MARAAVATGTMAALAAAAALAACGSVPSIPWPGGDDPPPASAPEAAPAAASSDPGAPRLGVLSPRSLARGECGLFLWTRAEPPELVFFSNPETGRAAIVVDGAERSLRRLSAEGSGAAGRPGAQTFATEAGDVSLRLTIQESEPVQSGYRVGAASLRVTKADGWSGVVAAAGLAACQS